MARTELTRPAVDPFSLPPGESYRLGLDPTVPPPQYGGGYPQWEKDHREGDFRLWVTCHVEGDKPWALTADVPQRLGETTSVRWAQAQ
ncbi:hypothetical protein [Streptomyces goshikiensis]|uniref:hypothetical protein n=1 Tax=Streptomyces goshikiensis TaxID=1942 RepID=UPI002ADF399D|nr:hypothetical protein [Streptomyces goshikiensis]